MENQDENPNHLRNRSLLSPRTMFGDFIMMKKKLITLMAVTCLMSGVGCASSNTTSSSTETATVEKEGIAETTKKDVALKLMSFVANKTIGKVDNASYSIVEDKEFEGYKLNVSVTGLHAGLKANVDGLDEATTKVVSACEKTSSSLSKLLDAVKISDSNFQVNILDDTDNSVVLYSATNGETTINEITE